MKVPEPDGGIKTTQDWARLRARRASVWQTPCAPDATFGVFLPNFPAETSGPNFVVHQWPKGSYAAPSSFEALTSEPTAHQPTVKQLQVEIAALRAADAARAAELAELRARVVVLEDRASATHGNASETENAPVAPIVMAGQWLDQHGETHKGRWVALKDGHLMGSGASVDALESDLRDRGLSLKRMFVTRVR